jgi:lipoate-protein ligase A
MRLIINEKTYPYFNLALEERFLVDTDIEAVILWRNSRSVIIGRNQNAAEEINAEYARLRDIPVIRRQSGGGAVFHDLGNVNFTIIRDMRMGDFNNYAFFTTPVIEYLKTLGVNAELQGRNDLAIDGAKFCGNAQAVKNGRIMHHGCILYNADFTSLEGILTPRGLKFESHGVKSVRKRVTNIADHIRNPMTVEKFFEGICGHFAALMDAEPYELSPEDIASTDDLVSRKYSKWEWNYGKSPPYDMKRSRRYDFGIIDVLLAVERGTIRDAHIFGDFFGVNDKEELEKKLRGVRHERQAVLDALRCVEIGEYIKGMEAREFADLIC